MGRKFRIKTHYGVVIEGHLLNIQVVNKVELEREDLEYRLLTSKELEVIYYDKDGCIFTEWISSGDQIEFL